MSTTVNTDHEPARPVMATCPDKPKAPHKPRKKKVKEVIDRLGWVS